MNASTEYLLLYLNRLEREGVAIAEFSVPDLRVALKELESARPEVAPIGYAVRMADGPFVGIWQNKEDAELICSKQPTGHGDYIIAVVPVQEK